MIRPIEAVPVGKLTMPEAQALLAGQPSAGSSTSTSSRLDTGALFPRAGAYVHGYLMAVSESTQTPPEMPLLLGLAVASAAVANVAVVRGHGDHVEPAPIWSLVLAEPASRKSAVIGELLAPILAWERRRAEALAVDIVSATQRRRIDEKTLKNLEDVAARPNDPKAAAAAAQAQELAAQIAAEPLPRPPVLVTAEPTPEALARQMAANGGRALVASAEAGLLEIIGGRYTGTANYDLLLKAHAGDAVRAARVGREGDVIDRPALSLALCVQPAAVRDLWSDRNAEGRGLLARFALAWPEDRIGSRNVRPDPIPVALRQGWHDGIERLLSFEPRPEPVVVALSEAADLAFHRFQKDVEARLGTGDLADRRAWGGKLVGLALRIALTLHATRTWALMGQPEDFPAIDAETMAAALSWAEFLGEAERSARERLRESPLAAKTRRLLAWVVSQGGLVTARDLNRGPQEYRGDRTVAHAALEALVAAGLLERVAVNHDGKRGRPTDGYRLVADAGDTGDGDTNSACVPPERISVAVAASRTSAAPGGAGPGERAMLPHGNGGGILWRS
jgi:replicative DNA helicase